MWFWYYQKWCNNRTSSCVNKLPHIYSPCHGSYLQPVSGVFLMDFALDCASYWTFVNKCLVFNNSCDLAGRPKISCTLKRILWSQESHVTVIDKMYWWKSNGALRHYTFHIISVWTSFSRWVQYVQGSPLLFFSSAGASATLIWWHLRYRNFIDSVACLCETMILLTLTMYLMYMIWNKIDECFSSITPSHKKWYVMANLSVIFTRSTGIKFSVLVGSVQ